MAERLEVEHRAARAWLERVRRASAAIEPAVRELAGLEDARDQMLSWRTVGTGSGTATHCDPTAAAAEARMGELDALIADAEHRLEVLQDVVGECGTLLARMGESLGEEHARALELYYLDCAPTWSDVAWEMGVGRTHLWLMRAKAYEWIEQRCKKIYV